MLPTNERARKSESTPASNGHARLGSATAGNGQREPSGGGSLAWPPTDMARLAQLAISPEGFVFDPRTGESYTINPTGVVVLRGLQQGQSCEELLAELARTYEVTETMARADLVDFIAQLRHWQLQ